MRKNNVIFEHQFGFLCNKSTNQAILDIHSNIIESIEKKNFFCCILHDFAKVFDTIDQEILPTKLEYFGMRGTALNWIKSYLCNCSKCVSIDSQLSDELKVTHSVPQGIVLDQLLLLSYINDIPLPTSILNFHPFADDSSFLYSHDKLTILKSLTLNSLRFLTDLLHTSSL